MRNSLLNNVIRLRNQPAEKTRRSSPSSRGWWHQSAVLALVVALVTAPATRLPAQAPGGDDTAGEAPPPPPPQPDGGEGGIGAPPDAIGAGDELITGAFRADEVIEIDDGEIPGADFLKFLSHYTGLPVLIDSKQLASLTTINIAAPIRQADGEIVKAILESNGLSVTERVLPSGRSVIRVEGATTGAAAAQRGPEPSPIIVVTADELGELANVPRPDEVATMIFRLRHREPADVIKALGDLVGGGGGGTTPGRAATRTGQYSLTEVEGSPVVVVKAKFGLLDFFHKLVYEIIDLPVSAPDRIIEIVDIENAYADELVQIIETFIFDGRRSTSSVRRTASTPASGTAAQGAAARARRTSTTTEEYETKVIAEPRTNKILIETYDEQDLQDIFMLIRALDIRYELRRLKTYIYQVQYLKADEVATTIQSLVGGAGFGGRTGSSSLGQARTRGLSRGVQRRGQTTRTPTPTTQTPGTAGAASAGAPLIVPHIETNSLIIQAEPEDRAEVLNILEQIDTKRRQVFLEAALVQVTSDSTLNFVIELLAGEPDDRSTRALFETSFGLSGLDFENFNRAIPDLSNPASVPRGALVAIMNRGKFPALIQFFKTNTDSQVLATPFILADDNMPNVIQILQTQFVQTTASTAAGQTTSQEAEDAGIILEITPTISSESAVFLEMSLEVSEFSGAPPAAGVLPPKLTNTITSAVTIPDGDLFVIGGLTRENKSKNVSKIPILGDIPLLGKLFRSEGSAKSTSNLYIFLRAHVLSHPEFEDHKELTRNAEDEVSRISNVEKITKFPAPNVPLPPPPAVDPDAPTRFQLNPGGETSSSRYDPESERRRYANDPESPFASGGLNGAGAEPVPRLPLTTDPATEEELLIDQQNRALRGTGARVDKTGKSWIVPIEAR